MNKNRDKLKLTCGILALFGWSLWELFSVWILNRMIGPLGHRYPLLALDSHADLTAKSLYSIGFVAMTLFLPLLLVFIWRDEIDEWIQKLERKPSNKP